MTTPENKPTVQLSGNDGNAFAIIGACSRAAKNAGWDSARISEFEDEMMSGDYNNLLQVACKHFDVR